MDVFTCEIGGADPETEAVNISREDKDLPPEYTQYKDEGCEYARACLDCPFPQCIYDEPHGRRRWLKELRDREINRLFKAGRAIRELAAMFDVSDRTVQRAVNNKVSGDR